MFFSPQDEDKGVTAGEWLGKYYFHCAPKRGLFVKLQSCQPDVRFQSSRGSDLNLMEDSKFSGRGDTVPCWAKAGYRGALCAVFWLLVSSPVLSWSVPRDAGFGCGELEAGENGTWGRRNRGKFGK